MTFKLVLDLFLLLTVLGLTAIVLMGWGNLTWRLLSVEQPSRPSVLTVWLGFCIVVVFLEFIHLFVPIDWKVSCSVAIIGFVGQRLKPKTTFGNSRESVGLITMTLSVIRQYPLRTLLGTIVIVAWCLRAMETPTMYDSGLYHFGSIRWLNEYPIIPGLGNLHWRLALNQSYFGFLAALNFSPSWGKGYATGGLFLLILTAFTLLEIGLKQSKCWRWTFSGILFAYLCLLSGSIANPLPDTAVSLAQVVIFVFLYVSFMKDTQATDVLVAQLQRIHIVLGFLCLTIVTVKLSSLAFAIVSFSMMTAQVFWSSQGRLSNNLLFKFGALLVLFGLVHTLRGYLLSGAPLFPSPLGGIWSLPWAVQFGVAHNESQLIYAWAKQPGIETVSELATGYGWVHPWWRDLPTTLKYLFIISSIFTVIIVFLHRALKPYVENRILLLGLPLAAALCFWFFSAPDPRFLGAGAILYFAWSTFIIFYAIDKHTQHKKNFSFVLYCCYLCSAVMVVLLFFRWSVIGVGLPLGWRNIPIVQGTYEINPLGYSAFVPSKGATCWAAELPCTMELHGGLKRESLFSEFGMRWNRFQLSMER